MEVSAVEVQRSRESDAQRAERRELMEEVRRQYPSAKVSGGEHVEHVDGVWRAIPVVVVEFASGQRVTFFAQTPEHPTGLRPKTRRR
jgi:uncharacterized protein (DUF1330 family)